MQRNTPGALYFVLFFTGLLLGMMHFVPQLPPRGAFAESVLLVIIGTLALLAIPFVYLNYPDIAGWLIMLLAVNQVSMAFVFAYLPFSWSYLGFFVLAFSGLVAGVPFQERYHPPRKKRTVRLLRRKPR